MGSVTTYCIAAPGAGLLECTLVFQVDIPAEASGTSMAAPMVSGGLALIKQEFSSLTNAQVVDRLFATATDTGEYSQKYNLWSWNDEFKCCNSSCWKFTNYKWQQFIRRSKYKL